jgi:ornithine--oxo-acid transaminase
VAVGRDDADGLSAAVGPRTAAVIIEPIQGEAGVIIPPDGFLRDVWALCDEHNVLMVADEIQSGLARTGRTFACDYEDVVPDIFVLGKALGGGLYPVSAIAANHDVLDVITPGSHGSTFGGNPLAAAIGREVIALLRTGDYQERANRLGATLTAGLESLKRHGVVTVRARGLWAGVDVDPEVASGRQLCERLMAHGVLAKDTHGSTIRLAPPLVAEESDIEFLIDALSRALTDVVR